MHHIFPGYPPADHEVRIFLTKQDTEAESYRRACCFIGALFQHTDHTLEREFDSQWGIEKVAHEFRNRMTTGQTMREHNKFRRRFYHRVVRIAQKKLAAEVVCLLYLGYMRRLNVSYKLLQPGSDRGPGYNSLPISKDAPDYPATSCRKLIESLKARKQHLSSSPVSGETEDDYPLVILAFDEAHTLTNREETGYARWSNLSVLRHVLCALHRFPLFALFLSTTSKISQFTSPGDLILTQPFTNLGFDTLAKKVSLDGHWDLERVTTDSHIVHMGRPL